MFLEYFGMFQNLLQSLNSFRILYFYQKSQNRSILPFSYRYRLKGSVTRTEVIKEMNSRLTKIEESVASIRNRRLTTWVIVSPTITL